MMFKYLFAWIVCWLVAPLSGFGQDQYAAFDWHALSNTWMLKPTEYQAEEAHKKELAVFKFFVLELAHDGVFSARFSAAQSIEGTFTLDEQARLLHLKPVGGFAPATYSVARVEANVLIMDKKNGGDQWPMLVACTPALPVAGDYLQSTNVYKHVPHGYSWPIPKAWEMADNKYLASSDNVWFWASKNAVVWIDYSPYGFNLTEKQVLEKLVASEKGSYVAKGKVPVGKKSIAWHSVHYEHSQRQRLVYVLLHKKQHLLVNIELPTTQLNANRKYLDGLIKQLKLF